MLRLTSEYALRAMICLVRSEDGCTVPGKFIARETGVPSKYLSKILGDLVREGILTSTRGKTGGFQLNRPPRHIKLLEILAPFELHGPRRCPFGNQLCSDEFPCLAHDRWKKVVQAQQRFLSNTSIQDVAHERGRGTDSGKKARRR